MQEDNNLSFNLWKFFQKLLSASTKLKTILDTSGNTIFRVSRFMCLFNAFLQNPSVDRPPIPPDLRRRKKLVRRNCTD
jgi:hypothetical protein